MSAFYCVAYGDRVELLTDGATYQDDGTLTDVREKVWRSPSLPLAVTGRGNGGVVNAFATGIMYLSTLGTFDQTIGRVATMIERRAEAGVPSDCEIVIAGISETGGPRIFFFATHAGHEGLEPWKLYDVGQEWGGGPMPDVTGLDGCKGLAGCGAEIFERMRRIKGPNPARPDLPEIFGIGGHVDLTVVTADGVTTERLRTWPDVIGEPIDPFRVETGRRRRG